MRCHRRASSSDARLIVIFGDSSTRPCSAARSIAVAKAAGRLCMSARHRAATGRGPSGRALSAPAATRRDHQPRHAARSTARAGSACTGRSRAGPALPWGAPRLGLVGLCHADEVFAAPFGTVAGRVEEVTPWSPTRNCRRPTGTGSQPPVEGSSVQPRATPPTSTARRHAGYDAGGQQDDGVDDVRRRHFTGVGGGGRRRGGGHATRRPVAVHRALHHRHGGALVRSERADRARYSRAGPTPIRQLAGPAGVRCRAVCSS